MIDTIISVCGVILAIVGTGFVATIALCMAAGVVQITFFTK